MLKCKLILILNICFFTYACNKKQVINNDKIDLEFAVNDWKKQTTLPLDIVNEIKFIPLETIKDNLIGNIDKIVFNEENICILDSKYRQDILIFERTGKFVKKIGNVGHGAGEYLRLTDFNVDKHNNQVIILDDQVHKLIFFNLENEAYIRDYKLNFWASNFIILNEQTFLFYSKEQLSKEQYLLAQLNIKNNKCKWFVKKNEQLPNVSTRFSLFQSNNNYFTTFLNDVVYKVNDQVVEPYAKFNFKQDIPQEILNKASTGNVSDLLRFLVENNFSFNIENFIESSDFITFDFQLKSYPTFTIYSKKTGNYIYGNHFDSPLDKLRPLRMVSVNQDEFVCAIDASSYIRLKNEIQQSKNVGNIKFSFPQNDNSFSESNPVLIFFKFKMF